MQSSRSQSEESLSGQVDRVTYHNDENGFSVLKVRVKGRRELVTVLASLPAVSAGEWLTAEGDWKRDERHGLQFKASTAQSNPPSTRKGIEKYLGSGMVKGIGPVYAKKLVAYFGEGLFEIIDEYSARLEEVPGIGGGRRKKIKSAWEEQKAVREIMIFLHSNGVSTSRAVRIHKLYGEEAIDKVRENPYRLAQDIPGIGFLTADQIAKKVGISQESIQRAEAGIRHVLLEQTNSGHCAFPREDLTQSTEELLQVDTEVIVNAIDRLLKSRDLIAEEIEDQDLLYLPAYHQAEIELTAAIRRICHGKSKYPQFDYSKAVTWFESESSMQLAEFQKQAIETAFSRRMVIITGGPGVGKTTLMNAILTILHAKKVKSLLCAPTGRAAKRLSESTGVEAKTIHRLLEFQPGGKGFAKNQFNPLVGDLVVVDECSMVDLLLMHKLMKALPREANLILVGDIDQLPSVGAGSVLSHLIQSGIIPVVRLTEVFRQAQTSRIITAAHSVNQGYLPDIPTDDKSSDYFFIERDEPEMIVRTMMEVIGKRIPDRFGFDPIHDIQVLCPMNRGSLGARQLNQSLQDLLNSRPVGDPAVLRYGWEYRLMDKVIQKVNNYKKEVFNGDIGQIVKIDTTDQEVEIQFDQNRVIYDFGELDEVDPAYAITIHKSQGSEFPVVIIPLASQQYLLLQRNLIYTGITRGRKLVVLIGQKKAYWTAVRNNSSLHRFSGLLYRLKKHEH
ncbi:MAG TPA: ATP-dependent RecD-like DNA helicase [Verrucomicrobiales bacterium]|nr:ATP-dependent RecD-like DNA helicase [Verrucomicrobiales bacterium]